MKRLLSALGMVLVMGALAPATARAQEDADTQFGGSGCNLSLPVCGSEWGGHTAVTGWDSNGGTEHSSCMLCQSYGITVAPAQCHSCGLMAEALKNPSYVALLEAARSGNVSEVLRLARRVPGQVTYNSARKSVQIHNPCATTTILANLPVESATLQRVAAALPGAIGMTSTRANGTQ